jgi:inhibitor of KinA sporulation pathway (predicted exonuclease)
MRYAILDLEATCCEKGKPTSRMETIEIGAVMLESSTGPIQSEFSRFVRPIEEPVLSEFCTQLTGSRQQDVDTAEPFAAVFPQFVSWLGPVPVRTCSWGIYDVNQLRLDCQRHGVAWPSAFDCHINLKREYARLRGIRLCGMKRALSNETTPLEGQHHRAISDARNIASLARLILPVLEGQTSSPTLAR